MNLRSNKGSITLFVLTSCLFFIASVTCMQIYIQSKQTAVDKEYRQIKSNYEKSLLDESNLQQVYEELAQPKDIKIANIETPPVENNNLIVKFNIEGIGNIDIKNIKYGWGTSQDDISTVSKWTYLEKESIKNKIIAINNNASSVGNYYLFVAINDEQIYKNITVTVENV